MDSARKVANEASKLLKEIKDLSGLSWIRIARLVGVSRQAIYDLLDEKSVSPQYFEKICQLAKVFRNFAGVKPFVVRSFILAEKEDSTSGFDLLRLNRYQEFLDYANCYQNEPLGYRSFMDSVLVDDLSVVERLSFIEPLPKKGATQSTIERRPAKAHRR
ncbi:hypothetical protein GW915_11415 [bacterium]|nr:hypothetical protein [bacterium]